MSSTRNYLFSSAGIEYEKDGVSLLVILALPVTGLHDMNWVSQSASFPEL